MNQVNLYAKRDRQWCAQKKTARGGGAFYGRESGWKSSGGSPTHHRPSTYLFRVFGTQALPSPEAERNYTGLANALLADVLFDSKRLRLN